MRKVPTEQERRSLFKHFLQVGRNDPLLRNFPRKHREIFADRMVEVEIARINGDPMPTFPPEGYEVRVTKPELHFSYAVLKDKAAMVEQFDDNFRALVNVLFQGLEAFSREAVGLAAPQIGVSKRVAVIDYDTWAGDGHGARLVLVNPELDYGPTWEEMDEECMSFLGEVKKIKRATSVMLAAQDQFGRVYALEADGRLAQIIQHEVDHLNGLTIMDKRDAIQEHREAKSGEPYIL